MYIGPHRASRRQRVRYRYLGPAIRMRTVLAGDTLPGHEGIGGVTSTRDPWDFDDAASYLKYGLCQIELDRREAIADVYDSSGIIPKDSLPDVWAPLRELASNLLPHLNFEKIDTSNREQVQCLWSVHGTESPIDIDDLSSGEKSVIQLFFPLVEHRVRALLRELKGEKQSDPSPLCALIDEPELHLHPNLQTKILGYLRTLSVREHAQFIIATHSPTIVENANSDELYLQRPATLVPTGENQLTKVATSDQKLELLRDVFGTTANLTAMHPILVVEGQFRETHSRRASDARIYPFLSDEFSRISILPSGGKAECKALVRSLNTVLGDFSSAIGAHALLDRDLEESELADPNIHVLPVSMVENLLVEPSVLWEATTVVHHKMDLRELHDVEAAMDEILDGMEQAEIDLRIKAMIGATTFRVADPVAYARRQLEGHFASLSNELSEHKLAAMRDDCRARVEHIKAQGLRMDFYHGKAILDEFYRRHMHASGMSKEIFVYECARVASTRPRVRAFVDTFLASIGIRPVVDMDPQEVDGVPGSPAAASAPRTDTGPTAAIGQLMAGKHPLSTTVLG